VLFANLILDGRLETPYARNLLATIESVRALRRRGAPQGQAALQRDRQLPRRQPPAPVSLYTDEQSTADTDLARSR
jgi:hypothetical protein